jgi:hypothetical protein
MYVYFKRQIYKSNNCLFLNPVCIYYVKWEDNNNRIKLCEILITYTKEGKVITYDYFEARCTSLMYGKPYDQGVNLFETKINVFCSSVNSFVPKRSKFMVIFTVMFEMDNINSCLMSANSKSRTV